MADLVKAEESVTAAKAETATAQKELTDLKAATANAGGDTDLDVDDKTKAAADDDGTATDPVAAYDARCDELIKQGNKNPEAFLRDKEPKLTAAYEAACG